MSGAGSPAAARPDLVEEALCLLARLHSGEPAREAQARAAWQRWLTQGPLHALAARDAQAHWARAGGVAEQLRAPTAASPTGQAEAAAGGATDHERTTEHLLQRIASADQARRDRRRLARRAALTAAGTGALALLLGLALPAWWNAPMYEQRFAAGASQQLQGVQLPDGSRIDVDARTAVTLRYHRDRRVAELQEGRVRFDVRSEAAGAGPLPWQRPRSFVVRTPRAEVRVLGTAFTVSEREGVLRVSVEHGRVAVQAVQRAAGAGRIAAGDASDPPPPTVVLTAQQTVQIDAAGRIGAVQQHPAADAAAWRSGWLVFDDTPLAEAVAQVNAYRPEGAAPVRVDEAAGALRLTGRFRVGDVSGFLTTVPRVLSMNVHRTADGTTSLHVRR